MKHLELIRRIGFPLMDLDSYGELVGVWQEPIAVAMFGDTIEDDTMQVYGGVAVVPVAGIMGRGMGDIPGTCDTGDLLKTFRKLAKQSDTISTVVLNVDSPGGAVAGTPEVAAAFKALPQRKICFTSNIMASAAYYLCAGSDEIHASPSAKVGGIGVMMAFMDVSKMLEDAGIKMEVFASGDYKGMGMMGTSLTQKQRDFLQADVTNMGGKFADYVSGCRNGKCRNGIQMEDMQGQAFTSDVALEKGLIDGIEMDIQDVIDMCRVDARG